MLSYAITFFLCAVIAAAFGFSRLAGDFAEIARFLSLLFVVLFVATVIYNIITGKRLPPPV